MDHASTGEGDVGFSRHLEFPYSSLASVRLTHQTAALVPRLRDGFVTKPMRAGTSWGLDVVLDDMKHENETSIARQTLAVLVTGLLLFAAMAGTAQAQGVKTQGARPISRPSTTPRPWFGTTKSSASQQNMVSTS